MRHVATPPSSSHLRHVSNMTDGRVSFSVEAVVRGYHAYKDIWAAVHGEELPCERETGNRVDAFAVAVMKDGTVVGHVPKKISSICSLYLRRGRSIICRVTGSRRYSEDLIQGGLEIPCVLIFEGGTTLTTKAKKLVVSALLGVTSGVYLHAHSYHAYTYTHQYLNACI